MEHLTTYEQLLERGQAILNDAFSYAIKNGFKYEHDEAVFSAISAMEFIIDISARFIWANDWHNDLRFIELHELCCAPSTTLHALIVIAVTSKLESDLLEYSPRGEIK